MGAYIKLKNLTKGYKKKAVLENISLDIKQGDIFGIIGMSGSGKTTFLNTLIGFLKPEKGDVEFYSDSEKKYKSIFENQLEMRKSFGFATQAASFYPRLTVEENLHHFGSLYHLPKDIKKRNVDRLLQLTGLHNAKDTLARALSGGMEKKLGIACSLMHNPKVLILDEPTADLDPISRVETWNLIKGIHELGTTVIVASHFLSELEEVCSEVAILYNKKIVAQGSPTSLKAKYFKNDEIILQTHPGKYKPIADELKKSTTIDKLSSKDKKLSIYTKDPEKTIKQILTLISKNKEKLISLDVSKPPLTEIFETLTRSS